MKLSRGIGMYKVAVHKLYAELIEEKLVWEEKVDEGGGQGKPG